MDIKKLALLYQFVNIMWATTSGAQKQLLTNVKVPNIELNLVTNTAIFLGMSVAAR